MSLYRSDWTVILVAYYSLVTAMQRSNWNAVRRIPPRLTTGENLMSWEPTSHLGCDNVVLVATLLGQRARNLLWMHVQRALARVNVSLRLDQVLSYSLLTVEQVDNFIYNSAALSPPTAAVKLI